MFTITKQRKRVKIRSKKIPADSMFASACLSRFVVGGHGGKPWRAKSTAASSPKLHHRPQSGRHTPRFRPRKAPQRFTVKQAWVCTYVSNEQLSFFFLENERSQRNGSKSWLGNNNSEAIISDRERHVLRLAKS